MWILANKCQHIQRKTPHPSWFETLLFFFCFCFVVNVQSWDLTSQGHRLQAYVKSIDDPFSGKIKFPKKDIYTLSRNRHYTARLERPSLLKSWHFIQEIHAFRSVYGLNMTFQLHCTESYFLSKSPRHTSPHTRTNKNNLLYPVACCFWCYYKASVMCS